MSLKSRPASCLRLNWADLGGMPSHSEFAAAKNLSGRYQIRRQIWEITSGRDHEQTGQDGTAWQGFRRHPPTYARNIERNITCIIGRCGGAAQNSLSPAETADPRRDGPRMLSNAV